MKVLAEAMSVSLFGTAWKNTVQEYRHMARDPLGLEKAVQSSGFRATTIIMYSYSLPYQKP